MGCEEKQLRDVIFKIYYNLQIRETWADKVSSKLLFENDLYHREHKTVFLFVFLAKHNICAAKWIRNSSQLRKTLNHNNNEDKSHFQAVAQ